MCIICNPFKISHAILKLLVNLIVVIKNYKNLESKSTFVVFFKTVINKIVRDLGICTRDFHNQIPFSIQYV